MRTKRGKNGKPAAKLTGTRAAGQILAFPERREKPLDLVEIWTDGFCEPNPGRGGYAAILTCKGRERELWGCEPGTTNNRMEIMAAIVALEALKRPCSVRLTTDSMYLKNAITAWLPKWKRTGWKKGAIKNIDLWQRLDRAAASHVIEWRWVKGHAGNPMNERADALAAKGSQMVPASATPSVRADASAEWCKRDAMSERKALDCVVEFERHFREI